MACHILLAGHNEKNAQMIDDGSVNLQTMLLLQVQEAQLSLTNRAMLFCKVVEVLQGVLSD